MSRSGYSDDCDNDWSLIIFRGQVASAIKGKRGQAFLRELIEALDSLPEKVLGEGQLISSDGYVCALGSVGLKRGIPMDGLDPYDHQKMADTFGIASRMIQEITYENDEAGSYYRDEAPAKRWQRVRDWATRNLKDRADASA